LRRGAQPEKSVEKAASAFRDPDGRIDGPAPEELVQAGAGSDMLAPGMPDGPK
jgi:hypothetical protein